MASMLVKSPISAVFSDQMTARRLRLACGLVMFSYVALHLCMHSLGNVSFGAMESATRIHNFVWHSAVGTSLLYGAFLIHFSLALWALYQRRSFRMGVGEWTRLVLGFSILPLLIHHYAAGRFVYSDFGVQRGYDVALTAFFHFRPFSGWRQIAALIVAWAHGCLGLHYWLRIRPGYKRYAPVLLAIAVLLPVLALLGIWQGTREILAQEHAHPELLKAIVQRGHMRDHAVAGLSWRVEVGLYWAYASLITLVLAARGLRTLIARRAGVINVFYPGDRSVQIPVGCAVLDASRRARIPHASICGGRGRCTTCRVRVLRGVEALPAPSLSELGALKRLGAGPSVRLACQLRPRDDIVVLPLLPADITADDPRRRATAETNIERIVAIMFVDIRQSTALVEKRLPFDVVFLLNHFFDAVAGAVVEAGGAPNQFVGDGMMAIFGMRCEPDEACRQALAAVQMNRALANELLQPIRIGIGLHAGTVILGEIGYRDRFLLTAIGDAVHVAARLQDLTKEYNCQLVVSDALAAAANFSVGELPKFEVQVRGREELVAVRTVVSMQEIVL
jgi:adenylate cyclase